jgi:hypothetical protein
VATRRCRDLESACQTWRMTDARSLPDPLRRELLDYLLGTSGERAGMIAKLCERNPGVANLLMELEADDTSARGLRWTC